MNPKDFDLKLRRLEPPADWANKEGGLTFVLPRSGAARCVFGAFDREVVEGDVHALAVLVAVLPRSSRTDMRARARLGTRCRECWPMLHR